MKQLFFIVLIVAAIYYGPKIIESNMFHFHSAKGRVQKMIDDFGVLIEELGVRDMDWLEAEWEVSSIDKITEHSYLIALREEDGQARACVQIAIFR